VPGDAAPQNPVGNPAENPAEKAGAADAAGKTEDRPAGEDPSRPDPTRFGDWEKNGRCIDF
jgi:hypothetical protein